MKEFLIILQVAMFPLSLIAVFAFLGFWLHRYDQQRRLLTGKPYTRVRSFYVARGRPYSALTTEKSDAIKAEGYKMGYDPKRGHFINIPGDSHIDRVHKAREIGFTHHLMLLY
jgi:hypothetical protein